MNRGDNDVELVEHSIGKVERAVGQNINLAAGKKHDAADLSPNLFNLCQLFAEILCRQAAGDPNRLAVVGQGAVLIAPFLARAQHLFD